ncbi:MAG TPA: AmmeMemoRadiSam system radical SAM enzyme [Chroococcales cyanobacterium]|jgi:pyruvate formate lyase activating enzyme
MEKSLLFEKNPEGVVSCGVCQHRCFILPGKTGFCRNRLNQGGELLRLHEDSISAAAVDPIEKKPLFHFHPGSKVFSLGGIGCNFRCRHCQNWNISQSNASTGKNLSPDEAVELAIRENCAGLAWTYNEPTVWLEYALAGMKKAKENGLYTVFVTNGYLTPEALDLLGPHLDAFRVDLKGFGDRAYNELCRISSWRGILDVTLSAKKKWGMHVEVVTNLVPTINDDRAELTSLAGWIFERLGEKTPWHITRFHPCHELSHLAPTPVSTIEEACRIGKEAGLKFIYSGNLFGSPHENTLCPRCGRILLERTGYRLENRGVDQEGKCSHDGEDLAIAGKISLA